MLAEVNLKGSILQGLPGTYKLAFQLYIDSRI